MQKTTTSPSFLPPENQPIQTVTLDDVLKNNRFAVLATMHHSQRKQNAVSARVFYNVQPGKDQIIMSDVLPAGVDAMDPTPIPCSSSKTFYGHCYNCHYRAHSQKHCPLRRCARCGLFGHIDLICEKQES